MPIPLGPCIRKDLPVQLDGLIRTQPYRDSNGALVEAGTIEQFVPVLGHRQLVDLPVLEQGGLVKPAQFEDVEGPGTYTYSWTTEHTKTVEGTVEWTHRGERYSRDWSKTYSWTKLHKTKYSYYDRVLMLPRKAVRHLNHCDHSKVRGELWLAAADMGFTAISPDETIFRSTWPLVAKDGKMVGPWKDCDYPADRALLRGKTAFVPPGLYRGFVADRMDSGTPYQDICACCMGGLVYIGPMEFSGNGDHVGTGHVYAQVSPNTTYLIEDGRFKDGSVRLWHWLDKGRGQNRYTLWASQSFDFTLPLSHSREVYESAVRKLLSSHWGDVTWSLVTQTEQLTFAEDPDVEYNRKEMLESAYSRLWSAVLPDRMESVYKQVVGHAGQDALLNTKVLNINSIMYVKDFFSLRELCDSYADLLRKGINPKTVSGAYLASHYGVKLTIQDTRELIERAKRELRGLADAYQYSYGSNRRTFDGPVGRIDVRGNVSVLFTLVDARTMQFLSDLARWDFLPTPRVIWDMIPYSFVLDWILPVGGVLEHWDRLITEGTIHQKRCCWSLKTVAKLNAALTSAALLKTGTQVWMRGVDVELVGYRRAYQRYAPSPDALLDLLDISPSWSSSRAYEITSLTIQKLG